MKLFKAELQTFANATGLEIHVSHFPPGTRKWNAIEHELFSAISLNWRGRPLETFETVVQCIGHTRTHRGGPVQAVLDERAYEKGHKVDAETSDALNLTVKPFTESGMTSSGRSTSRKCYFRAAPNAVA